MRSRTMLTYTDPTVSVSDADEFRLEFKRIRRELPRSEIAIPALKKLFAEYIPSDHILVTFTGGNPSAEQYRIFPDPSGGKKIFPMNTTSEQFHVIQHAQHNVIRLADESDHSIVTGLLNQIFGGGRYSLMIVRTLLSAGVIATFCFVSKKQKFYTEQHVNRAFALFKEICEALDFWCVTGSAGHRQEAEDMRQLPLMDLPGMAQVNEMIWSVARQNCPVLIQGETGTGKEVVANTIYRASARVYGPFIKINCGGIPENLVDSELFGHEKGSFTDAISERKGCFERADRGVLLLDEIGELPLLVQARLLRVLQEGTFERVGGSVEKTADVRIVAATHRNLFEMVQDKSFREDLYYRLNVFTVYVPPLRFRPQDIPFLLDYFVQQKCARQGAAVIPEILPEEREAFCSYTWPGNIRELNNAVERAVILWIADTKKQFHLRIPTQEHLLSIPPLSAEGLCSLDEAISRHIQLAVRQCNGKVSGPNGAAQLLKVHPNTLRAKMIKLGLL